MSDTHADCVPRQDYDALMAQFNATRQANANLAATIKDLQAQHVHPRGIARCKTCGAPEGWLHDRRCDS